MAQFNYVIMQGRNSAMTMIKPTQPTSMQYFGVERVWNCISVYPVVSLSVGNAHQTWQELEWNCTLDKEDKEVWIIFSSSDHKHMVSSM